MTYEIKPLPFDPSGLDGLSERLLRSHHDNNYAGAVRRLNAIAGQLAACDFATAPGFVVNGLKREELIAANSMILHEAYFESLGGRGDPPEALQQRLALEFGSHLRWRVQFEAMGKALGGGSGWVLLVWSSRDRRLLNQWAPDHTHCLAGAVPVLALDMYEHSYHMDYGAEAAKYVEAFMHNISWERVGARLAALG